MTREELSRDLREQDIDTLSAIHSALGRAIEALATVSELEEDRDDWKKKYDDLLNSSVKHSHEVTAGMLGLAIRNAKP